MTVIPLRLAAERRFTAGHTARAGHTAAVGHTVGVGHTAAVGDTAAEARADISGTFTSPTGRVGRMTGHARVRDIHLEHGHLHAAVVFIGQLCDADGSAIGTGSRRATAPAATAEGSRGRAAVIGPTDVDLLGLAVSVRPFVVGVDLPPED